jgi:hypothetical protein
VKIHIRPVWDDRKTLCVAYGFTSATVSIVPSGTDIAMWRHPSTEVLGFYLVPTALISRRASGKSMFTPKGERGSPAHIYQRVPAK